MSINSITAMGRIASQPEYGKTQDNTSYIRLRLALQQRNDRDNPCYISAVAWRHTADYIARYGAKGSQIVVSGELQMQRYQDRNNYSISVNNAEIIAPQPTASQQAQPAPAYQPPYYPPQPSQAQQPQPLPDPAVAAPAQPPQTPAQAPEQQAWPMTLPLD